MSLVRVVPVVLLICTVCGACSVQKVQRTEDLWGTVVEEDSLLTRATGEVLRSPSLSADTVSVSGMKTPDEEEGWASARRAAQIDPEFLMYTEPPPGTEMPILESPKNVDPEMIHPSDRLNPDGEPILDSP